MCLHTGRMRLRLYLLRYRADGIWTPPFGGGDRRSGSAFRPGIASRPWVAPDGQALDHITNLVFMGMGEPMHNYDNTLKALRILNMPEGLNIGARHMTISTVGLVPGIMGLPTSLCK